MELRVGNDELPRGDRVVHGFSFRDQTDAAIYLFVAPHLIAIESDRSRRGGQEAGHHVDHRGLPGAVRTQQSGHARTDGHRDVIDRDDVPEPARHLVERHRRHDADTDLYRSNRIP
jgi:hypothetical protein